MSAMLEAAARAVATATGDHYSGDSIIENAEDNPRLAHFVAVARAVIDVVLPIERNAIFTIMAMAVNNEREECAQIAEQLPNVDGPTHGAWDRGYQAGRRDAAAAIRKLLQK